MARKRITKKDARNMNKKELSEALRDALAADAKSVEISKSLAGRVVDQLFDAENGVIANHLFNASFHDFDEDRMIKTLEARKSGNQSAARYKAKHPKVTIPGFGTFGIRYRQARKGQHPDPAKQSSLDIPATFVVTFKAGKGLREGAEGLYSDNSGDWTA